ncbi:MULTISPECIES: hypothetical protein [Marinitoga]|uniref:hypothetical protein n=1 Tax=Marinitoga TaxID=160798 RepID=UPI0013EBBBCB|nr:MULTISPECIES: hypothetical protein [Marinitoga]KAF2956185.1 hypothetical protein AS160_06825 [Marinitoga sp. 38H-ov]MBM7560267.1 hypothetical protein [Marinitoga litoralis]
MKRNILMILFMLAISVLLLSENLTIIKKIKLDGKKNIKPVLSFTKDEVIITPIVAKGKEFEILIYSLKSDTKQIIKKESPALYEINNLTGATLITTYAFENKFWIICGNEKNGDMEINEYIKKEGKYIFNKKLNLGVKSFAATIDYELKDKIIMSVGINESERKVMIVDIDLNWYKELITLKDFSGILEMAKYKDKLYIFETIPEKSVTSFFGSNSKYIKLKHTFDAKNYELIKKDEKTFSDMNYYTYIYQDEKYVYFGNYGGKINIKRYNLDNNKIENINMEEIYQFLKEGNINYHYYTYKNEKILIEVQEDSTTKIILGKIIDNKFKILWEKELKKSDYVIFLCSNTPFKVSLNLQNQFEIFLFNGNIYKINLETGNINKILNKAIHFFKMKDKYYGVLNEIEKKEDKNLFIFEVYELKLE